jgi:uncharacterized protein HemY
MIVIKRKMRNINGIAIFPFIFVTDTENKVLINHEKIHIRQQLEMLVIPFYLWYFVEWLFKGYRGISFEIEAYENQSNLNYLKKRNFFSWFKYLRSHS